MLIRWTTLGLVLGGLVGHAVAAGQRFEIPAARERLSPAAGCEVPGSTIARTDVPVDLHLIDGSRFELRVYGGQYRGSYVPLGNANPTGRAASRSGLLELRLDPASQGDLESNLTSRVAELCASDPEPPRPTARLDIKSLELRRQEDREGTETGTVLLQATFAIIGTPTTDRPGRFSLGGTGTFGPLPGAVDLISDADADGLPDELEAGVDAAIAIASGGNPDQLDDSEVEPFATVLLDLADRLPFSARSRENQQDILELAAELEGASPGKARRILRGIGREEEELRKDPAVELVMTSLDRMFGPAAADGGTAAGVPAALVTPRRPLPTRPPAFSQLQRGDVMLLRSKGSFFYPWVWYYSHAGTYDGNNMVYESVGSGVQLGPLQHWKERGTRVGLGRSTRSSPPQVVAALDQAKSRYGTNGKTPYNFIFPNKLRDDAIYCSQLTWKIHRSLGVDMDSNDVRWFAQMGLKNFYAPLSGQYLSLVAGVLIPAVAPDEVYYSPNVSFYSEGDN